MKRRKFPSVEAILITGVACIIIAPLLLTRSWGFISFTQTGTIGDTIGGITAPITGLLGAFLLYKALRAQIDANEIMFIQFEHQKKETLYHTQLVYITQQVNLLREDIRDFKFGIDRTLTAGTTRLYSFEYSGNEAIGQAFKHYKNDSGHNNDHEKVKNSHLLQIHIFLKAIFNIKTLIQNSELEPADKAYVNTLLFNLYFGKLYPVLHQFEDKRLSKMEACTACRMKHTGLPEYIYELYDRLNVAFGIT